MAEPKYKVGDILSYILHPESRYVVIEVVGHTIVFRGINGGQKLHRSDYHVYQFYRVLSPLEQLL